MVVKSCEVFIMSSDLSQFPTGTKWLRGTNGIIEISILNPDGAGKDSKSLAYSTWIEGFMKY